jgi:hypothetical protein
MPLDSANGIEPTPAAPAVVLADASPKFDAIRTARAAHVAALADLRPAQGARTEVDDLPAEHAAAVRKAVADGKKPPAALDPAYLQAWREAADAAVSTARRAVWEAAQPVEEASSPRVSTFAAPSWPRPRGRTPSPSKPSRRPRPPTTSSAPSSRPRGRSTASPRCATARPTPGACTMGGGRRRREPLDRLAA